MKIKLSNGFYKLH